LLTAGRTVSRRFSLFRAQRDSEKKRWGYEDVWRTVLYRPDVEGFARAITCESGMADAVVSRRQFSRSLSVEPATSADDVTAAVLPLVKAVTS